MKSIAILDIFNAALDTIYSLLENEQYGVSKVLTDDRLSIEVFVHPGPMGCPGEAFILVQTHYEIDSEWEYIGALARVCAQDIAEYLLADGLFVTAVIDGEYEDLE